MQHTEPFLATSLVSLGMTLFALPLVAQQSLPVLGPSTRLLQGLQPTAVSAGDWDGDGDIDLLTATVAGSLIMESNDGSGVFATASTQSGSLLAPTHLILEDFDGDGVLDLVSATDREAELRRGASGGPFGPATTLIPLAASSIRSDVYAADVDGDGDLDLLETFYATFIDDPSLGVQLALNDGAGNFGPGPLLSFPEGGARWAAAEDLDADGLTDIVLQRYRPLGAQEIRVALASAPGAFGSSQVEGVTNFGSQGRSVALGDLDLDGHSDLVLLENNFLVSQLGQGNGSFGLPMMLGGAQFDFGWNPHLVLADADRDGLLDAIVPDNQIDAGLPVEPMHVLRGTGGGEFEPALLYYGLRAVTDLVVDDFDGDGDGDLALVDVGLLDPAATEDDNLTLVSNLSYAPGGPFTDLGSALPNDTPAVPLFWITGLPVSGQVLELHLEQAASLAPVTFVLGASTLSLPFSGGVMVPAVDVLAGPHLADGTGALSISSVWTIQTTGFSLWVQAWVVDAAGPHGFSASSAVRIDVP